MPQICVKAVHGAAQWSNTVATVKGRMPMPAAIHRPSPLAKSNGLRAPARSPMHAAVPGQCFGPPRDTTVSQDLTIFLAFYSRMGRSGSATRERTDAIRSRCRVFAPCSAPPPPRPRSASSSSPTTPTATASTAASPPAHAAARPRPPPIASRASSPRPCRSTRSTRTRSPARSRRTATPAAAAVRAVRRDRVLALTRHQRVHARL